MSWQTDDGRHQGAALALFADGALAGSHGPGDEITVCTHGAGKDVEHNSEVRSKAEVIGWREWCACGWRGQVYTRVHSPELDDRENRLVYEPSSFPPEWVDEEVYLRWREHIDEEPALAEVADAALGITVATNRLDEAVARARRAGASWAAIGARAGVTRQAVHTRWAGN